MGLQAFSRRLKMAVISLRSKARMVVVRALPCSHMASAKAVTVSSSGASMMLTASYGPIVHRVLFMRPPRLFSVLAALVVVGRTNVPELGLVPTTEPEAYGPTRNPWDPSRSPGGSSGGSAAAVASGMVAVAHGNDAGGSIRIPAAACGIVGLKPTRGRTSLAPEFGELGAGTVHQLAVTRSLRDTAALLDLLGASAAGDPYFAPPPERPYVLEVAADPGRLR